jgi:hypothetical protein
LYSDPAFARKNNFHGTGLWIFLYTSWTPETMLGNAFLVPHCVRSSPTFRSNVQPPQCLQPAIESSSLRMFRSWPWSQRKCPPPKHKTHSTQQYYVLQFFICWGGGGQLVRVCVADKFHCGLVHAQTAGSEQWVAFTGVSWRSPSGNTNHTLHTIQQGEPMVVTSYAPCTCSQWEAELDLSTVHVTRGANETPTGLMGVPTKRGMLHVYPLRQILVTTVHRGHVPLPLQLGNERLIWSVAQ